MIHICVCLVAKAASSKIKKNFAVKCPLLPLAIPLDSILEPTRMEIGFEVVIATVATSCLEVFNTMNRY